MTMTRHVFERTCLQLEAFTHYAIQRLGISYLAALDAPNTWEALQARADKHGLLKLLVYDGHSETTIYSSKETNYAARAWHDYCHLAGRFDFTPQGEVATAKLQEHMLRAWWSDFVASLSEEQVAYLRLTAKVRLGDRAPCDFVAELLRAEVVGQVQYVERWAAFPNNQRAFAWLYVNDEVLALGTPNL